MHTLQYGLIISFGHHIDFILSQNQGQGSTCFLLVRAQTRLAIYIKERNPQVIGIALELLHSTSVINWPIIPYYHLSPFPFLDLRRLPTQSSLHSSYGPVGEGEESLHVIATINASI